VEAKCDVLLAWAVLGTANRMRVVGDMTEPEFKCWIVGWNHDAHGSAAFHPINTGPLNIGCV
jgi:hypothetical protein